MIIAEDNELLFSVLFERDFLPQDAEALLGFKPKNGRHACVSDTCVSDHHGGEQSIGAIEHTFGTQVLNTLAGAVNDGDRIQVLRPKLDTIFVNGVNSSDDADNVYGKLVAACPDGWEIK